MAYLFFYSRETFYLGKRLICLNTKTWKGSFMDNGESSYRHFLEGVQEADVVKNDGEYIESVCYG